MPRYRKPKVIEFGGATITVYDETTREGAQSVPHIIIRDDEGHAMRLVIGKGRAGLSATLSRVIGGIPLTLTGNTYGDSEIIPQVDASEVSVCVYKADERSQAFKRWYGDPENNEHPGPA